MLTQVVLQTATPVAFDIEAVDPDEILVLKSISGLSPADMILFIGDYARDGGYYQGRRVVKRNPVFNFKINPDYKNNIGADKIREKLYRWFLEPNTSPSLAPSGDGLMVVLKDDVAVDRYFISYPEKVESDVFGRDLGASISTICTDPYIWAVADKTIADAAGLISLPVDYDGTAKAGFKTTLKVTGNINQITLDLNGFEKMIIAGPFVANDIVVVNTKDGERSITKNGVGIMGSLSATSKWLKLVEGVNTLETYVNSSPGSGLVVITEVNYREAWLGV